MADPVFGSKVLLQFKIEDTYIDYACATDCRFQPSVETISTKTVGDGINKRYRGKSFGYQVTLSGLVKIDDPALPKAFDLIQNYMMQLLDVDFRMVFEDDAANLKIIQGNAIITSSDVGGDSENFATGDFTLVGNGPVSITDASDLCGASIANVTVAPTSDDGDPTVTASVNWTGLTGATRIDYAIDGGGRLSIFGAGSSGIFFLHSITGAHEIILYPVCDNGNDGTPFIKDFTI